MLGACHGPEGGGGGGVHRASRIASHSPTHACMPSGPTAATLPAIPSTKHQAPFLLRQVLKSCKQQQQGQARRPHRQGHRRQGETQGNERDGQAHALPAAAGAAASVKDRPLSTARALTAGERASDGKTRTTQREGEREREQQTNRRRQPHTHNNSSSEQRAGEIRRPSVVGKWPERPKKQEPAGLDFVFALPSKTQ